MPKVVLLQKVSALDALAGESVDLHLAQLRKELLPANPSQLQQLAADRVVITYAEIYLMDAMCPLVTELSPQQAKVVAKAKDSAQRRYGLALKTLAAVNRMAPALPKRRKLTLDPPAKMKVVGRA